MLEGIPASIIWLVLAIIFVVIETATMGIITIWFALGALLSLIASFLGADILAQTLIFIISSGIMLYFTRPIVKKYLNTKKEKTNADQLVGTYCTVIEEIDNFKGTGQVKIKGLIWTVRSIDDEKIMANEKVLIKSIKGVKLIVEKSND